MAEANAAKPAKPAPKTISDVTHPGKSAPSTTSKPVIVTNRPLLRDPMVNLPAEATTNHDSTKVETAKETSHTPKSPSGSKVITPLAETTPAATEDMTAKSDPAASTQEPPTETPETAQTAEVDDTPATTTPEPTPADQAVADGQNPDAKVEAIAEAEAAKQAEHDAAIQKLVDSKQYYLPINSVEQRKSKRFVVVGILLAVILAVAWLDIALDANLISLGSVQPVTHFFSN